MWGMLRCKVGRGTNALGWRLADHNHNTRDNMTRDTPTQSTPSTQAFLAARDQLLNLRGDPAAASAQFRWPQLTDFN